MASVAGVCRHAARVSARSTRLRKVPARDLHSAPQQWAAQSFVMPAMSPTMTEGNIASWKVKEGDKFSTGDVLLEIETDKAQMDVEAQDEGIMAKIMYQDGAKAIKVGTRIAVLAEEGDDIKSLDIPEEDTPENAPTAEASSSKSSSQGDSSSKPSKPSPEAEPKSKPPKEDADRHPPATSASRPRGQKYPLYPSVQHLMHQNHLPLSDASKIPASGPNGRLLKGDVLSYLGSIDKSYSSTQSKRLSTMSHLDLSKVQKAESKPAAKEESKASKAKEAPPVTEEPATQVAVPISLAAVFATQRRIQESLGLKLPLSTFIARASEIANENLPRMKGAAPSSDELFDAVLGLSNMNRTTRGHYSPQITALPPPGSAEALAAQSASRRREADVMDLLTGAKLKRAPMPARRSSNAFGVGGAENVFSVNVAKGEETRARTYLERVKTVLEAEPGRCVL